MMIPENDWESHKFTVHAGKRTPFKHIDDSTLPRELVRLLDPVSLPFSSHMPSSMQTALRISTIIGFLILFISIILVLVHNF
jgi:hypothetical protein